MKSKIKVLITGGHLTPGLAVIDEAQANHDQTFDFVWLGRVLNQNKSGQKAGERKALASRKIRFIEFDSGKTSDSKLVMLIKLIKAYIKARAILKKEKPTLMLSFGGYLAVPVAKAASDLKIPVITHEQTRVLGKANEIVCRYAQVLALSYDKTQLPPLNKNLRIKITGNPIRRTLFQPNDHQPLWWPGQKISRPILYISGGSQGAQAINEVVATLISELSQIFFIVHQVGPATKNRDYVAHYLSLARENKADLNNYCVRPFLNETELRFLYPRINLAVSRAGANSVAELSIFNIPALYIPLPGANYNEQQLNAEFYVKKKAAYMLLQTELKPETLRHKIAQLNRYQDTLKEKLLTLPKDIDADRKILHLVREVVSNG